MKKIVGYTLTFEGRPWKYDGVTHVYPTRQLAVNGTDIGKPNSKFKLFRLVRRPKVKPGTVGYVVKTGSDYCSSRDWIWYDKPASMPAGYALPARKVFSSRAEAEAICVDRKIFAVVRKPKPPPAKAVVGYAVRWFDGAQAREYVGTDGNFLQERHVFKTRQEAKSVIEVPFRNTYPDGDLHGPEYGHYWGCKIVRIVQPARTVGYAVKMFLAGKPDISGGGPWRGIETRPGMQDEQSKPVIMTKAEAKKLASCPSYKPHGTGRKVIRIVRKGTARKAVAA